MPLTCFWWALVASVVASPWQPEQPREAPHLAGCTLAMMPLPLWQLMLEQVLLLMLKLLPLPATVSTEPLRWAVLPALMEAPSTVVAAWQFWQSPAAFTCFAWLFAWVWSAPA